MTNTLHCDNIFKKISSLKLSFYSAQDNYADDICLLSPSVHGLQEMVDLCLKYAQEFSILFNGSKSHFLRFCPKQNCHFCQKTKLDVTVGDTKITLEQSAAHLGHNVRTDFKDDAESVYAAFYKQYNIFRTRFTGVPSSVKYELFLAYCSSFYGIQICDLAKTDRIQTAWRKCLRDLWRLPYRTHSCLLPALSGSMCAKHMFMKRFIKFACNGLQHNSQEISYVFRTMSHLQSTFSKNVDYVNREGGVDLHSLVNCSVDHNARKIASLCQENCCQSESRCTTHTIEELSNVRDGLIQTVLNTAEINELILNLCLL
jgi:hypothetical protein